MAGEGNFKVSKNEYPRTKIYPAKRRGIENRI